MKRQELEEIVEKLKAEGEDLAEVSVSFQMRGRTYEAIAKYLTEHDGEIAEYVPSFLGMGSVYMAIDEIEQMAKDMLSVARLCLMNE